MSQRDLSRNLMLAAGTALAVGAGAGPALAAAVPETTGTISPATQGYPKTSTPLGKAIVQESNIHLDSGLQRSNIKIYEANLAARRKAGRVVEAVAAQPGGRQPEIKRVWLEGNRYLITGDVLLLRYLHGSMTGRPANELKNTGLKDELYGSDLQGWAWNGLSGNPGRLPRPY